MSWSRYPSLLRCVPLCSLPLFRLLSPRIRWIEARLTDHEKKELKKKTKNEVVQPKAPAAPDATPPAKSKQRAQPVSKPAARDFGPVSAVMRGAVRFFDGRKRYFGFITAEDGRDIYVHRNHVKKGHRLYPGTKVEFIVQSTPRGDQAKKVRVID